MIPSPAECFSLMSQYDMLDNIKAHSILVGCIAEFIAQKLHRKGIPVSVELSLSAALLHDIGKTSCLYNDDDHAKVGQEICFQHGFSELAPIVRQHVVLIQGFPHNPISEREIVYYADKRVKHDQIVSLDSRLSYILKRYGQDDPRRHRAIKKNFEQSHLIEKELFSYLDDSPGDLADCLKPNPEWLTEMSETAVTK